MESIDDFNKWRKTLASNDQQFLKLMLHDGNEEFKKDYHKNLLSTIRNNLSNKQFIKKHIKYTIKIGKINKQLIKLSSGRMSPFNKQHEIKKIFGENISIPSKSYLIAQEENLFNILNRIKNLHAIKETDILNHPRVKALTKKKTRKRTKKGGNGKKTKKNKKNLLNKDYKKILTFYKLSIPKSRKKLKKKALNTLTKKYCSCLKKVKKKFKMNGREIGICTNSVIKKKGFKRGKFSCKKKRNVDFYKGGKKNKKTRKL